MVNSVDSDSVSECAVSTHSATGSTTEYTDSLLKFKSYGFLCRIYVTYISGVFVLVIFDSLLKEFYGIMGNSERIIT